MVGSIDNNITCKEKKIKLWIEAEDTRFHDAIKIKLIITKIGQQYKLKS